MPLLGVIIQANPPRGGQLILPDCDDLWQAPYGCAMILKNLTKIGKSYLVPSSNYWNWQHRLTTAYPHIHLSSLLILSWTISSLELLASHHINSCDFHPEVQPYRT